MESKSVTGPQDQGVGNVQWSNTTLSRLRQIFDYVQKGKLSWSRMKYENQNIAYHVTFSHQMLMSNRWSSLFVFRTSFVVVWAQSSTIVAEILLSFLNPPPNIFELLLPIRPRRLPFTFLAIHNLLINQWFDPLYSVLLAVQYTNKQIQCLIIISVINQLDAQNFCCTIIYFMLLHVSSTCAHHQEVKIALHSLWYHHTETSEWSKINKM